MLVREEAYAVQSLCMGTLFLKALDHHHVV